MKESKSKWVIIAIIAAVVAAVTTIVVLVLRARAKRKAAWYDDEADYGFEMSADDFEEMSEEEIDALFADESDEDAE